MPQPLRISIIIPSFNQAKYLEETLRSVIDQSYPNLELIVIDGGSTDGSVDVIRRNEPHIAYWVTEKDRGQTHAINKGLEKITGEVWSYLNSDDLLCSGSLAIVGRQMSDPSVPWVGGVSDIFDESGSVGTLKPVVPKSPKEYIAPWNRPHPYVFPCSNVSFMRRDLIEAIGMFDESYDFAMDIDYYCRAILVHGIRPKLIDDVLGRWRHHPDSKTIRFGKAYGFHADGVRLAETYARYLPDEAERRELLRETRFQKRLLPLRLGMYEFHQRRRARAVKQVLLTAARDPSYLLFPEWAKVLYHVLKVRLPSGAAR